jgi:peptidyl-prolyl cis-trans isomerase A (cyclophilin A)
MSRSALFALLLALSSSFVVLPGQAQAQSPRYACAVTNMGGEFCMEFLRDNAPNTVDNFLKYVNRDAFDNTFVHRSVNGYVVQAGGYKLDPLGEQIPDDGQIKNEFSASNLRGTVAMAKLQDQPDSATTEWFVNIGDNSDPLNTQNGGFTVFAKIVKGMALVDAINSLGLVDLTGSLGDAFGSVPVLRKDDAVDLDELVQIVDVYTTDVTPVDESDPDAEEQARTYQCTADWVAEIFPQEVCMETNMGNFCMDLMHDVASRTVANFLHYVADGDYDNTFIHRLEPDFVFQGGALHSSPLFSPVLTDPTITNEYSTPNTRGTVAMAKQDGNPDSANSQWFVNLADNSEKLGGNVNGGYSVFARVHEADMAVIESIGKLERLNLSEMQGLFPTVPMIRTTNPDGMNLNDFVLVKRAYIPGHEVNPCLRVEPVTTTKFVNRSFTLPVRLGGELYEFQFNRAFEGTPDDYIFAPFLWKIRTLKDVGQDAAEYSPETRELLIPSVYQPASDPANDRVLYNVRLVLTDPATLKFELVKGSFSTEPPATTP